MPNAAKIELSLEGHSLKPMAKSASGIWSTTTDALPPDIYGYSFIVDGQSVLDSQNPSIKPNLLWPSNMVTIPGSPGELWEVQDVPHGTVHRHFYKSGVIGDQRDFYVYTPPGYGEKSGGPLPVLYLLHGFSDTANGWTAVGLAHVILDNLIAQGQVKPMLVVMPLGYGVRNFASPGSKNFGDRALAFRNYENFRGALLTEVLPQVEKEYRVKKDRENRAIAGLSMGGAETLFTGLNNIDKFAYIGAFSSGGLPADLAADFPALDPKEANNSLRQLWIACGTEDGLITANRGLVKWLESQGMKLTAVESPGSHTWMVWRRNLITFTQLLFKDR